MKRFLSVMMIALLVSSGAFAVTSNMTPSATKPDTGVTSTVDVGLDVELAAMTSYAFGFSSIVGSEKDLGNADLTKLPKEFSGTLALNYDAANGIGTTELVGSAAAKDIWMYCKIQSKDAVTLAIEASKMTDQNGAPQIDMTVEGSTGYTFGSGSKTDTFTASSSGQNGSVTITPSTQAIELNAVSYNLKVFTSKLPVLSQAAKYTGTITVHVAGA